MPVHHLPPELTSFVGRGAELAAVGAALTEGRVLTLVGPGGCGKTRLAVRACHELGESRPDVVWVGLENERDGAQVARRVADALDVLDVLVPAGSDPLAAVLTALGDRDAFVVLDNCEHLLADAAKVVAALLARCPRVAVLATSRAPLGVDGERVWRVPPLDLADALELFLDRAGVAGEDAEDVRAGARRVCDRLDRVPLALELAAGWAGTLTPAQIADALHDPFTMLDGGTRTAAFRQRTLEGSMRWSHDLLGDDERVLFRWLGVFEPGFAAGAVTGLAALGGPTADRLVKALRGLIDTSLVVADTAGPVARYRMLGVVRDYALARLAEAGETERLRDCHLDLQLALVDGLAALVDTDKDAWRAAVAAEYPNVRSAIEWGLAADDPARGRRLAAGVAWLWHLEGRGPEGMRLLRLAAGRGAGERTALQAEVMVALALVADTTVPGGVGLDAVRDAAELAAETGAERVWLRARSLAAVGEIGDDLDRARREAAVVRDDAARAGDAFVADASAVLVGLVDLIRDDHAAAIACIEPALDGLLRRGDRGVGSSGLGWLAQATAYAGDLRRASELAERAVMTAEPLRDFHRTGSARSILAEIRVLQGRLDLAEEAMAPMDRLVGGLDEAPFIPGWERVKALIALDRGQPEEAVDWCRREARWHPAPADEHLSPQTRVVLATALMTSGDDAAAGHLADEVLATPMTAQLPGVRAAALAVHASLAADGDPDRALALQHEALRIRNDHGLVLGCIDSLESLAELLLRRGADEPASVLTGAARRARRDAGATLTPSSADGQSAQTEGELTPSSPALVERGEAMSLPDAVAYAARARGPRRRPDSGWESLTPTERSVVDLAVQGMSNPEIATRLFMSRGTVKTHLAHVYAKLQVANRTELARLAAAR
ncbi:LuxR C-terminal-related transcriptional regulator [Jiangella asiatica]|uniref:LuxR family transcriptional regulator n=1 Tax=Jiangella asiatica TaxID=2530372 RepID=A0A4R5CLQ5_9ACTN|nr:LuxR C-terminal-related transcriptional regulator [Jiangella asiatica]TDE00160.1 LuxR family transcriptional regulator [Jiangella asiatica]